MRSQIRIFIGSSVEGRGYAECIGRILSLDNDIAILPWWDRTCFPANATVIESLENITGRVDGAILIATPDDRTTTRGEEVFTPSINVMLEYGLFLGCLSRFRVAIAQVGGAHLPSDLAGVTCICLPTMEGRQIDAAYESFKATPPVLAWLQQLAETPDLAGRLSPHLQAVYERADGNLRVIIPALKRGTTGDSALPLTGAAMITLMTSVEGMAYGWLLKAFSPIIKGGRKIDCLTAYQGQPFTRGFATFVIGGPSTNEETRKIFARVYAADFDAQRAEDYGEVIVYKGEEFRTHFSRGLPTRDFSFLIYRHEFELFVCAGTSPFGTAGAVSMLTEPYEGEGAREIPSHIIARQSFVAIGEVEIFSETFWRFKRVLRILLDRNGAGASNDGQDITRP